MSASIPFDLVQMIARYEYDLIDLRAKLKAAETRSETARNQAHSAYAAVEHHEQEIARYKKALGTLTEGVIRDDVVSAWWATAREEAAKA